MHASAFFVLLGSGLVLYIPSLSRAIARRPLIKDIHIWTAVSWAGALALIVLLGAAATMVYVAARHRSYEVAALRAAAEVG